MINVIKGSPAELAACCELVQKASGRKYPRTTTGRGPTVVVTAHAPLNAKAGWYEITPQAKEWLAREQTAAPQDKLLTEKETSDLATAMAKEEPLPEPSVVVVKEKPVAAVSMRKLNK